MSLFGILVRVMPLGPGELVQVRFPRSKKKRIRKKWRRDRRNFIRLPEEGRVYLFAGRSPLSASILCNQLGFVELQRRLDEAAERSIVQGCSLPAHLVRPENSAAPDPAAVSGGPAGAHHQPTKSAAIDRALTADSLLELMRKFPKPEPSPFGLFNLPPWPLSEPKWPERDRPNRSFGIPRS